MTVMAILGAALVRMLVSDSRFVSRQDAMVSARQTARYGMNMMATELRMASDSGLVAVSPDSVTVRIPYAFGMTCRSTGSYTVATLIPPDSLMYAGAVADGMAWRDDDGVYHIVEGITVKSSADQNQCDADSIRVVSGGRLVQMSPATGVSSGRLFHLYQLITYRFSTSAELPGRIALWRTVGSNPAEEIVTPFDASAGFAFLVGPNLTLQETPPGDLETARGLELRLIGASESTPQGASGPETFELVTQVVFVNKGN